MTHETRVKALADLIERRLGHSESKGFARKDTLRRAAIMGLSSQLQRISKHNAVDFDDLRTDIKRALTYLRDEA